MDMDSKYNIGDIKSKLQTKLKPRPVVFNNRNGQPSPKKMKLTDDTFKANISSLNNSNGNSANKERTKISIQEQKRKLPVYEQRHKLLEYIRRHNTLIIMGETGCGKSTQIPQYILSARLQGNGKIAITQPRRVAAVSLAMRVSNEIGNGQTVGETVGYIVRFENVATDQTKITYLTDGMLLRAAMADNFLMDYNVIILDEAHERTIHTDILFGIVKNAQKIRREKKVTPLKIIIMSATMDVDHFSQYFNKCQVIYLEGRTYPVNVYYTIKPHTDYQSACVATFFKIHRTAPPDHDVLIFLTGQEEIERVAHQIRQLSHDPEVDGPAVRVCTLYAAQTTTAQVNVFQPAPQNTRKVVISTNIAETSITISGIRYVIDSGMVKVRCYHPSTGLESLKVQRTSQEQSWQRAGRAGRDCEGHCYRIYTRAQYEQMQKSTVPEILRANLSTVILQVLALGINPRTFDFMDKPPKEAMDAAYEQLRMLGAVEKTVDDGDFCLTALGKQMAKFPLDPKFSKMLISAPNYGCLEEMLTIVAILSGDSILLSPPAKREIAQSVRQKFCSGHGDHLTLLNIFREYSNVGQSKKRGWCHEHFINLRNILHAREVRNQLEDICKKCGLISASCGSQTDQVRKCLLAGLFMNVAQMQRDKQYITLDKRQVVSIHPSSDLHGQLPFCVLFTEVVQTNKCYLRSLTTVECEWLQEVAPEYMRSHRIIR